MLSGLLRGIVCGASQLPIWTLSLTVQYLPISSYFLLTAQRSMTDPSHFQLLVLNSFTIPQYS